jgi:hypothetical protein
VVGVRTGAPQGGRTMSHNYDDLRCYSCDQFCCDCELCKCCRTAIAGHEHIAAVIAAKEDEIKRLRKERSEYADEIYRLRAAIDEVLAETYGDHQPKSDSAEDLDAGKELVWCGFCGRGVSWPCTHRMALDTLKGCCHGWGQ